MIFFRLIQGAAAGIIQPLSQAIVLDLYPKQEHGRVLAIWGATIMAGPMLGPVLGGLITDHASWRWIFAVNAPIGAIAVLGLGSVPSRVAPDGGGRIDGIGITLLVLAVGSLQLALQRSIGRILAAHAGNRRRSRHGLGCLCRNRGSKQTITASFVPI